MRSPTTYWCRTSLSRSSLEHKIGGVKIYETALKYAQNEELREEWERYHSETETHVRILRDVFSALQLNPEEASPGREIIREMGISLVKAMEKALAAGEPAAAQIVACECVVIAETKDHLDWQLIGQVAKKAHWRPRHGTQAGPRGSRGAGR